MAIPATQPGQSLLFYGGDGGVILRASRCDRNACSSLAGTSDCLTLRTKVHELVSNQVGCSLVHNNYVTHRPILETEDAYMVGDGMI